MIVVGGNTVAVRRMCVVKDRYGAIGGGYT